MGLEKIPTKTCPTCGGSGRVPHNEVSNPQREYIFGIIDGILQPALRDLGNDWTKEEIKDFIKQEFFYREVGYERVGLSFAKEGELAMTKEEFHMGLERLKLWAAEYLSVVIPEPEI